MYDYEIIIYNLYLSKAENIFEGVAVNGKALGGVIHQPFFGHELENTAELGRTIWGYVGLGAFGNFQQIKLADQPVKITVTRFLFNQMTSRFNFLPNVDFLFKSRIRSHRNQVVEDCLTAVSPDEVLRQGGAGNKVLRVIEGNLRN